MKGNGEMIEEDQILLGMRGQFYLKNTLQELQKFLSKNDNIRNFLIIRVNGWIIWGTFISKSMNITSISSPTLKIIILFDRYMYVGLFSQNSL